MVGSAKVMLGGLVGLGLAAGAVAQSSAKDSSDKPKLICKKSVETGSLIGKRRECRTREDWDRISEAARMNGQDMVDRNGGRVIGE